MPGAGELDARSLLFSETPTRWILEVETGQVDAVKAALGSTPHAVIGETTQEQILRVTHQTLLYQILRILAPSPPSPFQRTWRARDHASWWC